MPPTEFSFLLPRGLLDAAGTLHQQGRMRLATAKDEIVVQKDRRAQESDAYADLIRFARVITRLGALPETTPELLEGLFTLDLSYLREFYNRINQQGAAEVSTRCPACSTAFKTEFVLSGKQTATL